MSVSGTSLRWDAAMLFVVKLNERNEKLFFARILGKPVCPRRHTLNPKPEPNRSTLHPTCDSPTDNSSASGKLWRAGKEAVLRGRLAWAQLLVSAVYGFRAQDVGLDDKVAAR